MVGQLICNQWVEGSIPFASTIAGVVYRLKHHNTSYLFIESSFMG